MSEARKIFLVCTDDETSKDVGDRLKRISSALSAVDTLADFMAGLPDDREDEWANLSGPALERLWLTSIQLYPNPQQMQADIKFIGDFTTRTVEI